MKVQQGATLKLPQKRISSHPKNNFHHSSFSVVESIPIDVSSRYQFAQGIQDRRPLKETGNSPLTSAGDADEQRQERCVQKLILKDVRRDGYFVQTPDFAERARNLVMLERPEQFKLLPLNQAAPAWLEEKKLHFRRKRTMESYQLYIRNLIRIMGEVRLCEIHAGHLVSYQQTRMQELTARGRGQTCQPFFLKEIIQSGARRDGSGL